MHQANTDICAVSVDTLTDFPECQKIFKKQFPSGVASIFSLAPRMDMLHILTNWIKRSSLERVAWFEGIMAYGVALSGVNLISVLAKVTGQR